ncbi:hypothetical protein AVM71_09000 [Piscirickettsia salmonis]|nr:hypothetical protein AVM71_09000 [Piscirickettsia salmonis]
MPSLFPSLTDFALNSAKSAGQSALQSVVLQKASQVANGADQTAEVNAELAELADHCWKQLPQNVARTGVGSKRLYWLGWFPKIRALGEDQKMLMILATYGAAGVKPTCERMKINPNATYAAFPILGPKKLVMDPSLTRKNMRQVLKRKPILSYSNIGVSTAFSSISLDMLTILNDWSNTLNAKGEDTYENHYKDRLWLVTETYEFIDSLSNMHLDFYTLALLASRVYLWWLLTTIKATKKRVDDAVDRADARKYEILGHGDVNAMFQELFKRGYQHLERLLVEFCTRAFVCKLDELVNLFEAIILASEQFLTSRDILKHSSQKQDIYRKKETGFEYRPRGQEQGAELDLEVYQKKVIVDKIHSANDYMELCAAIFSISGAMDINDTQIKASDVQKYLKCVESVASGEGVQGNPVQAHIEQILEDECTKIMRNKSFRQTFRDHMKKHTYLYVTMAKLILKQMVLFSMNNVLTIYRDYMQEFGDSQIEHIGENCSKLVGNINKVASEVFELMKEISETYKSKLTKKIKDERFGEFRSEIYGIAKHTGELRGALATCAAEVKAQVDLYGDSGIKMSSIRSLYNGSDKSSKRSFLSILGIFDEEKRLNNSLDTLGLNVNQTSSEGEESRPFDGKVKAFADNHGEELRGAARNYYKTIGDKLHESFGNIFDNAALIFAATGKDKDVSPVVNQVFARGLRIKGYEGQGQRVELDIPELRHGEELMDEKQFYEVLVYQNLMGKNAKVSTKIEGGTEKQCQHPECREEAGVFMSHHSCRACWHGKFCDNHAKTTALLQSKYVCRECSVKIHQRKYDEIYQKRQQAGLQVRVILTTQGYRVWKGDEEAAQARRDR